MSTALLLSSSKKTKKNSLNLFILLFSFFCFAVPLQADQQIDSLSSLENYNKRKFLKQIRQYLWSNRTESALSTMLCREAKTQVAPVAMSISPVDASEPKNFVSFCAPYNQILTARSCISSSRNLLRLLNKKFKSFKIEHVMTVKAWSSKFYHNFLIVRDFYSKGDHLIIDPTHTQFLLLNENQHIILNPDYNLIFVGSYSELLETYLILGQKELPQNYLDFEVYDRKKMISMGHIKEEATNEN